MKKTKEKSKAKEKISVNKLNKVSGGKGRREQDGRNDGLRDRMRTPGG